MFFLRCWINSLRRPDETDAERLLPGLQTLLQPLPFLLSVSLGLEPLRDMDEFDAASLVNYPLSAFVHEIL